MERGKARTYTIAAGSNTRVRNGSGSLYGIVGYVPNGGTIRAENSLNLGAVPDYNAVTSNATIVSYGPVSAAGTVNLTFTPGVGFDDGLVVAATSNARFTVIYE